MENIKQEPTIELEIHKTQLTLLGTAHISRASADKVEELLSSGDYDCVAVELCPSRHNAMINPDALARMDLFQVIREGKATMIAANLALGAFQQRMAEQLDIRPGAEMQMAIRCADDLKLPVLLIDREIGTTLKRIYRNVSFWQRFNIIAGLLASVVSRQEVSAEEIERLKEGDILESAFTQFAEQAESLYEPLVAERDRYMAARLIQELEEGEHERMLAVVGAGHLKGIEKALRHWAENSNKAEVRKEIENLDSLPPQSLWLKYIPWLIVLVIMIGFGLGFSKGSAVGWQMVWDWVLINGGLSALGALIAMAHPLTILTAFVAAPITSLNPTIGAGMVTGAVETYMRRPKVGDFSRLRQDTISLKGWWKNRVTRILLVFLLSTLGSAAGTYLAGYRIFERLAGS